MNPGINNPGLNNPGLSNGTTNPSRVAPPSNQPNQQGNNQLPHGNPNDRKPFVPGPGPGGFGAGSAGSVAGRGSFGPSNPGTSNGEEDKEHKSNYLVLTDEYFDDDRMVAPPVIGG